MKNMLTVTGFPKSIWHSVQFTTGVRKQAEELRERIRQQAGGDEIEMQRLERELDMTEEELDMEAEHFDELASRLSPAQQTRLADTMRQIRALEDVRDTLAVEKERRVRRAEGDWEDNTPPNEPADDDETKWDEVPDDELERRQVYWDDDEPFFETGAAPGAEIEMGALGGRSGRT